MIVVAYGMTVIIQVYTKQFSKYDETIVTKMFFFMYA